jgi:hypothetical protein
MMTVLRLLSLPVAATTARRLALLLPGVLLARAIFSGEFRSRGRFVVAALRVCLGRGKRFRHVRLRFGHVIFPLFSRSILAIGRTLLIRLLLAMDGRLGPGLVGLEIFRRS